MKLLSSLPCLFWPVSHYCGLYFQPLHCLFLHYWSLFPWYSYHHTIKHYYIPSLKIKPKQRSSLDGSYFSSHYFISLQPLTSQLFRKLAQFIVSLSSSHSLTSPFWPFSGTNLSLDDYAQAWPFPISIWFFHWSYPTLPTPFLFLLALSLPNPYGAFVWEKKVSPLQGTFNVPESHHDKYTAYNIYNVNDSPIGCSVYILHNCKQQPSP